MSFQAISSQMQRKDSQSSSSLNDKLQKVLTRQENDQMEDPKLQSDTKCEYQLNRKSPDKSDGMDKPPRSRKGATPNKNMMVGAKR